MLRFHSMAAKRHLGEMGVLPDEMVWEILTWLPSKSLMRFKAVSKLWLSAILNPDFARAHRAPFRGLLVLNPDPSPSLGWGDPTRDFFLANLDDAINGGESNHRYEVNFSFQFSIPQDIRSFQASNLVKGIICFYDRNVAKLCNIATREIINLPESKCDYKYCTYHLGFDPIGSVYKLLKICPIYEEEDDEGFDDFNDFMEGNFNLRSIECEILTLGVDSSWRSIHPPPNAILPHGLCVDGVLYWKIVLPGMRPPLLPRRAHYSFNLAVEKFQSIYHPDEDLYLLNFGTRAALTNIHAHGRQHIITITDYCEGSWNEVQYNLGRSNIDDRFGMIVRGLLPNGDLMIYSHHGVGTGSKIYLYDEKRNYVQTFKLRFPASDMLLNGRICWYEESIISLKLLLTG